MKASDPKSFLGNIVAAAPRGVHLAHALIETGRVNCEPGAGLGQVDVGNLQMFNLIARWESGAADQQIEARLSENFCTDMWVCSLRTTVRRPLYAPCSLWKAQSDYYNARNPNIDFTLIIKACGLCDYVIAPEPTPFENLEHILDDCPFGIVIPAGSTFDAFFTNLRALCDGETPMEAIVTFSGMRLKNGVYNGCTYAQAQAAVQGVLSP